MTRAEGGLRITFVLPGWLRKPSGGARVTYRYASELAARGHHVTVVHGAFLEPWQVCHRLRWRRELRALARAVVDQAGGRPSGVPWEQVDPRVELRYVPTLAPRHVPDGDIVVATAWRTAESVLRYPTDKGAPHYLIQHYETWDGPEERVDATWRAPLTKIVIAAWLREVGDRLEAGASHIVPNAIDLATFRSTRAPEDRPDRVAMLYSPAPIKGAAVGIEALERAKAAVPGLQAVLFGLRPRPRGLPAWIDYVQDPTIDLLVDAVYGGSSIYLCPSLGEGWHLPPAEAMACGCAVVSSRIDGVSDYAEHGRTALLVAPGDAAELAAAIVELCEDPARRLALGRAGHDRIAEFSWTRSTDQVEQLFLAAR